MAKILIVDCDSDKGWYDEQTGQRVHSWDAYTTKDGRTIGLASRVIPLASALEAAGYDLELECCDEGDLEGASQDTLDGVVGLLVHQSGPNDRAKSPLVRSLRAYIKGQGPTPLPTVLYTGGDVERREGSIGFWLFNEFGGRYGDQDLGVDEVAAKIVEYFDAQSKPT